MNERWHNEMSERNELDVSKELYTDTQISGGRHSSVEAQFKRPLMHFNINHALLTLPIQNLN